MRIFLGFYIIAATFIACNSGDTKNTVEITDSSHKTVEPTDKVDNALLVPDSSGIETPAAVAGKQQYAYIKDVVDSNGTNYIVADEIQLLMGDKALEAAKKKGDAVYDKASKKYFLPDGYYIIQEGRHKKLKLGAKVSINLVSNFYRTNNKVKYNNLEGFKSIYQKESNWPFLISLNEAGEVDKLQQIYLP